MALLSTLFIYMVILVVIFVLLLVWPSPPSQEEEKKEKVIEPKSAPQPEPVPTPQPVAEPEPEPPVIQEPEPEPPVIQEPEPENAVLEREVSLEEYPEEALAENAGEEEKEVFEWNHNVRKITQTISKISEGNLKAINFCYIDRLINVRGKSRPIAFFLKPLSSQLSPSGVFIYDTTRITKDKALYLFVGPEAPEYLDPLGERLLQLMIKDTKCENVIRIIRDMECSDFNRMIHQMGGNKVMMQTGSNYGDQFFFEIQFFKTLLHIMIFEGDMMTDQEEPDIEKFPQNGAVVIDTSDNSLYLYVAHVNPESEEEKGTQLAAMKWMSDQPEFKNRELLIFDKSKIPPNLAIIFKVEENK